MLYHLLYPLRDTFIVFNVFRYITFRWAYAVITALLISFILGPTLIRTLKRYQISETIREDGPKNHFAKEGTPTMGGIMILGCIVIPTLLWADLTNPFVWIAIVGTLCFGVIGFVDDYMKLTGKGRSGLSVKAKLTLQFILGFALSAVLYHQLTGFEYATTLTIPFFKRFLPDMGISYLLLTTVVMVGASNAVNLTDGLDGLAIGPVIVATTAFTVIAYVTGHVKFAEYLNIIHIKGVGEITVFCGAMVGAGLGFLWFNTYPAQLFMGNVGALALGGALGLVAVMTKHELLLILVGGIFVLEAASVILQVLSYKYTGKRIFRMAPIHHHFEMKGWEEPKVIVRFWIIAIILALLSLSTLKLR